MSKHESTLSKLRQKSVGGTVKWTELRNLLRHLGYEEIKAKGGGSGYKFFHREKNALIICHKPHPSPDVDRGCIKAVSEHLEAHGFLKG